MRINLIAVLLVAMSLFLLTGRGHAAPEVELLEELRNCARTEDSVARIACYEQLGKRVLGEESIKTAEVAAVETDVVEAGAGEPGPTASLAVEAANVPESKAAEMVPPQPDVQRLPDDLGINNTKEKKSAEKKSYRGHVRSCGQTSDDRWYFVFDSGQMWKQSNNGTYRFKECDFDVTITKDFFGFKMAIDGGKTLRVKRRR